MRMIENAFWIYYLCDDDSTFESEKIGKWMHFFNNREFIQEICRQAIEDNIAEECKHSNADNGVACFYLNDDDMDRHKKVLNFFIENGLIRRTKTGRLYNISFKHDSQTYAGEYGDSYQSDIKLKRFINLETEKWLNIE